MRDDADLTNFVNRLQLDPGMRDHVLQQMRKQLKRGELKFKDTVTGKIVPPGDLDSSTLTIEWPENWELDTALNISVKAKDGRSLTGTTFSDPDRGYLWKK